MHNIVTLPEVIQSIWSAEKIRNLFIGEWRNGDSVET